MTIRNLDTLLRPKSVALVGASRRADSVGGRVLQNVLAGGFRGPVYAVNPRAGEQPGVHWVPSIEALPEPPDLAVVMTPAAAVPAAVAALGAIGARRAVVISAGVTQASGLRQQMLDAARPHLLRIVGPNCLGLIAPTVGLNASFAQVPARPGRLALISQSGALVTAILDWADARGIGFSGVVSVGDMADVDLGDLLDLFAVDPATDAILLYVEGVTDAAKFLSAARAAACNKPVIAIKAGRSALAAQAAFSHTGALTGAYEVYRAAFDRAGIVTVDTLTELFDAAEVICRYRSTPGDRLAIVTNGGGAGILAVDSLPAAGAALAPLSPATVVALDQHLPAAWSKGNPIDLIGDATAERYRQAMGPVLDDPQVDALLVMNCATAMADSRGVAEAVAEEAAAVRRRGMAKPILACWLGEANTDAARQAMAAAELPLYGSPDEAVRGFGYLLAARRARQALTDTAGKQRDLTHDRTAALAVIAAARAENRVALTEPEAKELLAAYHIPVVPTCLARSIDEIREACASISPPYALKVVSPHIVHKSDVGGVVLDLPDADAVIAAARAMQARIARDVPVAEIVGYAVQALCRPPHARELIAGIATDPTFGPTLLVGTGGKAVEVIGDSAIDLPPVDEGRARAMIGATRIAGLLDAYRDEPAADIAAVAGVLCGLSAMTVDLPDIVELDINPLLAHPGGVVALDARVRLAADPQPASRLVIRPAPLEWTADLVTRSGTRFHVRPVRADDEPLLADFFRQVSPDDLRFRFLTGLRVVDHDRLAAMTKVDYRRTITFLALDRPRGAVIATAMLAADPDRVRAEVALTTRADMKRQGFSWALFEHVLRYAEAEGIQTVEAIECADHDAALQMEREMGFTTTADPGDPTLRIVRRSLARGS